MDVMDVLSCDPEVVSGAVVLKGTRVPVAGLFEYLSAGDTLDEFLLDFPTVERRQTEGREPRAVGALRPGHSIGR